MRAAIYARVSSAGQRDRHTIESQLRDLPAFVERQGWTLTGTYVDDGKSAKAGRLAARGEFARLVADIGTGTIDVVAVVDQDRLTRSEDLAERGAILGVFQAAGVKIAVASTGQILDYRTDEGDLLGSLGAYFAAVENRKRRARRDAQAALQRATSRPPAARAAESGETLRAAIDDLARGCELAGPHLRHRVARALIDRCAWRDRSIAADLTIATASQVADSARRTGAPGMPIGRVIVLTDSRRRAA